MYKCNKLFLLAMETVFDDSHDEEGDSDKMIHQVLEEINIIKARLEPLETKVDDHQLILDRVKGVPTNPISSTIVYRPTKDSDDLGSISQEEDGDEFLQKCPLYFSFNTWCCCSS